MRDLTGKVALVTGGRVKIGYQAVLRLLRCGARVFTTTRFPVDAAQRYAKEEDFDDWKERLDILGPLDFQDLRGLSLFCEAFAERCPRLDILINNAAQTIARPRRFWHNLLTYETTPVEAMPQAWRDVLHNPTCQLEGQRVSWFDGQEVGYTAAISSPNQVEPEHIDFVQLSTEKEKQVEVIAIEEYDEQKDNAYVVECGEQTDHASVECGEQADNTLRVECDEPVGDTPLVECDEPVGDTPLVECDEQAGITKHSRCEDSAATGQESVARPLGNITEVQPCSEAIQPEACGVICTEFPEGEADAYGQQVDMRTSNTWVRKLVDVPIEELLQTHAVNAMAPFVLVKTLKRLMVARQEGDEAYIINVSAREGKFNKSYNSMCHPHTNMAKASLNMLTRTSADDYATNGIYMNSVDTGWVTDETPLPQHSEHKGRCDEVFEPPLDELDGAMRVLDPILNARNEYGFFLEDYVPAQW